MNNFWIRTVSAVVYVALFVFCIYAGDILKSDLAGVLVLGLFALFITEGCTYEYYNLVEHKAVRPIRWLGYLYSGLMCLFIWLVFAGTQCFDGDVSFDVLVVVGFVLLLSVVVAIMVQLFRSNDNPFTDVAHTLFPSLYVSVPLGLMSFLNGGSHYMMLLLILVWVNDACAYMGGSLIGKHKLWQRHSPGKTWEGCICGMVLTFVAAVVATPLIVRDGFGGEYLWLKELVLALIVSVVGTLGDLAESMLKRSVGVKDSGNIMPGHGGFLDRFDSLLAIIPFAFVFVLLVAR